MTPPGRTARVLFVFVAGLLVWEAYAVLNRAPGDTISEVVWAFSGQHPLLPFLLGLLSGHLFWQRK